MNNLSTLKIWFRSFLVFVVLLALDYFSKRWAISTGGGSSPMGILGFDLSHLNLVFVGINQKSLVLRMINYATFLGPLLLLYFFFSFEFLTIDKSKKVNLFLSIWVAGIVGNILDRIFYGTVIDFMYFRLGVEVFFNLATLMVIVGVIGFMTVLYKNRDAFIFSNKRKLRLLYANLQYDYIGRMLLVCLFLCLMITVFSYTFLKYYLREFDVSFGGSILRLYLIQMLVISILYLFIVALIGFYLSNRYVGPLRGFEIFIDKLEKGDMDAVFRVRENDLHQNLEAVADRIKSHWKP